MDLGFQGKIVIITGGAAGIGSATAELFAKEGAKVIIADIDFKKGKEIEGKIRNRSGNAEFYSVNIKKEEEVNVNSILKTPYLHSNQSLVSNQLENTQAFVLLQLLALFQFVSDYL